MNRLALITTAGLTAGLAIFAARWEPTPGGASASDAPSAPASAPADRFDCAFGHAPFAVEATTRTRVELDLERAVAQQLGGPSAAVQVTPAQTRETVSRWRLDLDPVDRDATGTVFAARLDVERTALEGDLGHQPALTAPFMVRVDRRCAITGFGWSTDAAPAVARAQQAVVAPLSFVAPAAAEASDYEAEGFDVTGRTLTRYAWDGARLTGRVLRYLRLHGGGASSGVRLGASAVTVRPGGHWFGGLDTRRTLTYLLGPETVGEQSTRTTARTVSSTWRSGLESGPGWRWGRLLEERKGAVAQGIDRTLSGQDIDSALTHARALLAEKGLNPAIRARFMREWLRANPEQAAVLADLVRRGAFTDDARLRALVFYALGAANTPESRAALMALLEDEALPRGYRVDAGRALTRTEPVPPGALDTLVDLATSPDHGRMTRGSMKLVVGQLAREQARRNPELAAEAAGAITEWLQAPGDDETLATALQAAGNAGRDDLLPAVEPYLDDERPAVRTQASRALRSMSPDAAVAQVLPRLAAETDPAVRGALLASAYTATQNADTAPPAELVQAVRDALPETGASRAFGTSMRILGDAAARGDAETEAFLKQLLAAEAARARPDDGRLMAIGRTVGTRWQAP